ncbi:MAG TPA: hypothetical protein VHX59_00085 [Mycobacteriales bacterium]|nr:hypothetical protein [Mycobacteriales bacterium]
MSVERGQIFRQAWIDGVKRHFPGEPKAGYIAPWAETPEWERQSAAAVFELVKALLDATDGKAAKLSRIQKGQFVSAAFAAQIFRHIEDPKPAYTAGWDDLPEWQRATDADIFEAVELA